MGEEGPGGIETMEKCNGNNLKDKKCETIKVSAPC